MNLRIYLATKNMNVKTFSEMIEYSRSYISRIIEGHVLPSERLAKTIEKATGGEVKRDEIGLKHHKNHVSDQNNAYDGHKEN